MPIVTLSNADFVEGDGGFQVVIFRASLDEAPNVPASFQFFTQEGSAQSGDYDSGGATVTFGAGETEAEIRIVLRGDRVVEGNETFEIVAYNPRGLDFPDQAAALVATGTILDNDDGIPDIPRADPGVARQIFGPTPEAGPFPTMTAYNTGYIEGDSGFKFQGILVTLDRPATTTTTVDYYTVQGTAANSVGDYDGAGGTVTFTAGQRSAILNVVTRGDQTPEPNETFTVVFTNPNNLNIKDGAQALEVTVDVLDNDSGAADLEGGIGAEGTPIFGPEQVDDLPTIRVQGVDVIEGNGGFQVAEMLVTLDGPVTSPVSFSWGTQDLTASALQGDYDATGGTVTFNPGQQSTRIGVIIRGDQTIEGDEDLQVLFTGATNARFEGGAAAIETTIGILGNDGGPVSGPAGRTEIATAAPEPVSTSPIIPVIQVHDATMIEGDGGLTGMSFLVTLDRPAPAPVTFSYSTLDGTASRFFDFDLTGGTFTIPAGQQSARINVTLRSDTEREDTESFDLFVYNATNANFAGNAIGLVATGTILDNDSGPVTQDAGRGDAAPGVLGPEPDDNFVRVDAVSISIEERDSGSQFYSVPILLSEPAREEVIVSYRTVGNTALPGEDYIETSGELRIPVGSGAGLIGIRVQGDTAIEGDETFFLELTGVSGAVLANGENTLRTELRIAGDDGAGTPATSADFELTRGASDDPDRLLGSSASDIISAGGGADTVDGLAGDDLLNGDDGRDLLRGNDGNDTLAGGAFADTLIGGLGDDQLIGGTGRDDMQGGAGNDVYSVDNIRDIVRDSEGDMDRVNTSVDFVVARTGIEEIIGTGTADIQILGDRTSTRIVGNEGDNILLAGGGEDTITGGAGADIFAFQADGNPSNATITDFGAGDVLALDDRYFGLGNGRINARELSPSDVQGLLRDGLASFNFRTLELSVDVDGPGGPRGLEVIATFTPASARELGVDDILIF
ncbi:hypothetical protein JANAI62_24480 [Jannaschia pagri]|uniref:Calx-beta domain-containing protein n=1 Tax=Jannaschia pagri TaxID=2829797 RepID=A0ABQ4NN32_9RHOB|nr:MULTISPECIES: Calx-beta domain-containing protein [unclassified Jannaschia]GIT91991.1 hypothetical protein JANAI61_24490 [Jannaschia sp. AI_61]GIT95825.1 hypothetical protein JANAI62_24480 [Jannaschia sp. AI_62]